MTSREAQDSGKAKYRKKRKVHPMKRSSSKAAKAKTTKTDKRTRPKLDPQYVSAKAEETQLEKPSFHETVCFGTSSCNKIYILIMR